MASSPAMMPVNTRYTLWRPSDDLRLGGEKTETWHQQQQGYYGLSHIGNPWNFNSTGSISILMIYKWKSAKWIEQNSCYFRLKEKRYGTNRFRIVAFYKLPVLFCIVLTSFCVQLFCTFGSNHLFGQKFINKILKLLI